MCNIWYKEDIILMMNKIMYLLILNFVSFAVSFQISNVFIHFLTNEITIQTLIIKGMKELIQVIY